MRGETRFALLAATLAVGIAGLAAACQPGGKSSPRSQERSHAADALIERARTPEERQALENARDEVDQEMREKVRQLDAEIEALRRENDELKRSPPHP